MKQLLLLLLLVFLIPSAAALNKNDFLQHIETKADITESWTQYRVCNPTAQNYVIDGHLKKFDVSFQYAKGSLDSYHYEISQDGKWRVFEPIGSTLYANKCYDVRIIGKYKASTDGVAIDNVLYFAGYNFTDYAWWNTSFSKRINISVAAKGTLSAPTFWPVKIILNSSYINYSFTNNDGSDIRCINSNGDSVGTYIEIWNESGDSIIYCNLSISNVTATQAQIYFNNTAAASASSFNNTFGKDLLAFYSENTYSYKDLSDNKVNLLGGGNPSYLLNKSDSIDKYFGSYDFEASDPDIIYNTSTAALRSSNIMVSFWMTAESNTKRACAVSDYIYDGANVGGWNFDYNTDGKITFQACSGVGNNCDSWTTNALSIGVKYHIVCSMQAETACYVNTVLNGAESNEGTAAIGWQGSEYMTLGDRRFDADFLSIQIPASFQAFDGQLDEVRVYGRILSADEISLLYSQPAVNPSIE